MQRINSFNDVASTGRALIDTGDGVHLEVPVTPVPDLAARLDALERDTDWIDVIPSGPAVDPAEPGVVQFRRVGDQVFCRVVGVAILPGASNAWLLPNGIPSGYRLGGVGQVTDVPGGYGNGALQPNRAVRHRLSIQEDDIGYVGYIHNWNGTAVEAARADGSRRIYGTLPSWITDDPFPA